MSPYATLARVIVAAALLCALAAPSHAAEPAGEVTVSFHVTLAPSWFDPSTAPPQITPFGVMYAIHDALVRPLPGQYGKGPYAYGGYPDLDEMFLQQSRERDPAKREAILHRIQQLTIDRAMYASIMDLRGLIGIGPRVADHAYHTIPTYAFPAYEDIRLRSQ